MIKHDAITPKSRDSQSNRDINHKTLLSPVTAHLYDLELETSIAKDKTTSLPRSKTEHRLNRRVPPEMERSINALSNNFTSQQLFSHRAEENGGDNILEMSSASDQLGMSRSKSEGRIIRRVNTSDSLESYQEKPSKSIRISRAKSKAKLSKKVWERLTSPSNANLASTKMIQSHLIRHPKPFR